MGLLDELAPLPDLNFTKFRTCPKCGRKFMSSPMSDFAASLKMNLLPAWARTGAQSVPTLPRIESAQLETGKLEHKVDELQARLDRVQEELPAPNRAVAEVREELGSLEGRLGEMGRNLEEARKEFLGLIPDATDLAYMKLAKAEVSELRGLLTRHLDDDHRRRNFAETGRSNRIGWAGVGVGLFGVFAGVLIALIGK